MRLVVFGEGMIERRADGETAYGGDAINTAVYLGRQGARPELMTAMGADPASERIVAAWADEGVGVAHVLRDPQRTAGAYAIHIDARGERSFTYDRSRSAARNIFAHRDIGPTLAWAEGADVLYLTGITLSIFPPRARVRIGDLAAKVRAAGGQVVFDTNYRPAGWPSAKAAWEAMSSFGRQVTLAMPSLEDHARLRGETSVEAAAADWLQLGAAEVVVKQGGSGAYVANADGAMAVPAARARVVDTTGAGDAFNAAYIAARLVRGASAAEAARAGAALAAEVIGYPGAIAPRPVGQAGAAQ